MRIRWGVALVSAGLLTSAVSVAEASESRQALVRTDSGWVQGAQARDHVVYQGIPYAAPPIDELRWQAPQPPAPWSGVRDATEPADRCAQMGLEPSTSEDCLYVNVTVPRTPDRTRPVLVWLHGGGLTTGAGSDYDARRLATRGNLVVVTVNYRLGNFGFFGHPGVDNGGAFGIEDQQAALRWVQRNARAFGGDPGNVTLAGESAGSHSVCAHLASPSAAGLFDRAIGQSTPCPGNLYDGAGFRPLLDVPYFVPQEWHVGYGQTVAAAVGCTDPATALVCLRDTPADRLLAVPPFPLPAYGNAVLPEDPVTVVAEGRFNRVPLLTGNTRDEGTLFAEWVLPNPGDYQAKLTTHFGAKAPAVAAEYPLSAYPSPRQALAAIMSDLDWAWAQQDHERRMADWVPVYSYEFLDRTAPPIIEFPADIEPLASHGAELGFLFDVFNSDELTTEQRRLGNRMIDYWAAFATTGSPNTAGLPRWQRAPYVQGLDLGRGGIGPFDRTAAHNLDFWVELADRQG
jgi:para-nitrobenzyl esterase